VAAKANFMKGKGCGHCQGTGFRGRTAIFELMIMSPRLRELTFQGAPTTMLRRTAIAEGMKTLFQDGMAKVLKGITTIEEVLRVAKPSEDDV
jgi:type IV pilus assembly protein PilB